MLLINFGHPLSDRQRRQIEDLAGQEIDQEINVKTQFDPQQDFAGQLQVLVNGVGLSAEDWQIRRILINPPSLHVIAVMLLAELHGRMGYFPPVLRLSRVPDSLPLEFEVAEIINLQALRDLARMRR